MKLICTGCQHQIQVDDSKVPGGVFKVKCPKCGKLVVGQKDSGASHDSAPIHATSSAADELQAAYGAEGPSSSAEDNGNGDGGANVQSAIKREVAQLRKEIFSAFGALFGDKVWGSAMPGATEEQDDSFQKKALICEDEPAFVEIISSVLKRLGYHVSTALTTADSLKRVETGAYDLITVDFNFPDDKEGGAKIIARINGQKAAIRRQTFVVLISASIKSADAGAAFFNGANITVNKEEIRHLENFIREGQRRFQNMYRTFNRIVQEKNERI